MRADDFAPIRNSVSRFMQTTTEINNIYSGLGNQTRFLDSPNIDKCFSSDSGLRFKDMKTKDITVYIVMPVNFLKSHASIMRLVIMAALDGLYRSPLPKGRLPILFMMDEFPALGHLSLVEAAMGAAAGYGVQLWPVIQNLTQLKSTYKESWQTFVDGSGAIQILGTNDNTTAEYFSQKAGKRTVTVGGESETIGADGRPSMGTSTHETGVPLIEPLEFGRLGDDKQIVFLYGPGPIRWMREPYFKPGNKYEGMYDPDPYHEGNHEPQPEEEPITWQEMKGRILEIIDKEGCRPIEVDGQKYIVFRDGTQSPYSNREELIEILKPYYRRNE